jgi:hypothetical protein
MQRKRKKMYGADECKKIAGEFVVVRTMIDELTDHVANSQKEVPTDRRRA